MEGDDAEDDEDDTVCVSLRSRSTLQHFTRATLYGYLQEKRPSPELRRALCASLHNRNARQHVIRPHFVSKFAGKMPRPRTYGHTLCERAQSKCTSTFHESHFIRKFAGKMPPQSEHPDQAPAFTPTVRTTQFGHAVEEKHQNERPAPLSRRSYSSSPTAATLHEKT